ncbi:MULTISPECIES: acylphosphatase [Arthrobacter]|uniref:acylphosphatase n=1 Tax=Arthrobacter sunyaminii TaxID=2816859 RepID=A0A975S7I0_9MICC|nr:MULTISPECIES: acylphosphatase [Arthrobacter]MBO0908236.1 acylphosphatase [Arthrobacter sunyaminii]QWQ37234.1 acylphosphatase [Arthrobacter sunyaminii]
MTPTDTPVPARRLTARITGEVQAVGFRYRTLQQAIRLGLTGLAANRSDGSVLVVAEGAGPALEELLQWLNSPAAPGTVSAVQDSWSEATGEFRTFGTE